MLAAQSKKKVNASRTVGGNGRRGRGGKSTQAQATTTQAGNPSIATGSGTELVTTAAAASLVGPATGASGNSVPLQVTGGQPEPAASSSRSLQLACQEASAGGPGISKFFLYVLAVFRNANCTVSLKIYFITCCIMGALDKHWQLNNSRCRTRQCRTTRPTIQVRLQLKVGFNVTVIHLTAKQVNLYDLDTVATAAVTGTPLMVTPQASRAVAAAVLPQGVIGTPISSGTQAPAMTTMTIATQPTSGYGVGTFVPSMPSLAGYSGPATNVGPATGSGPTPTIMFTPTAMDTNTSIPALAPPESSQPHWQTVALTPPQFNAAGGTLPVFQDARLHVPGPIHRQVDTVKALDMAGQMSGPLLVSPMRPSQKRRETAGNSDEDDEGEDEDDDDDDDDDDNDGFTQRSFFYFCIQCAMRYD